MLKAGDPLAMPWYSVNTSIMIQSPRLHVPEVKQVWLADGSAGGGRIEDHDIAGTSTCARKERNMFVQWIKELADREFTRASGRRRTGLW